MTHEELAAMAGRLGVREADAWTLTAPVVCCRICEQLRWEGRDIFATRDAWTDEHVWCEHREFDARRGDHMDTPRLCLRYRPAEPASLGTLAGRDWSRLGQRPEAEGHSETEADPEAGGERAA